MPPELQDYDFPGWENTVGGYILYLRVRSAFLNIHVVDCNVYRSPIALGTLQTYMAKIISGDEYEPDLLDYFDSVASYFLPPLRQLAPTIRHTGKLTLADIQTRQYYQCQLAFWDEIPHPSTITPVDPSEEEVLDDSDSAPFCSPFPSFRFTDVEVPYEDPETVLDLVPEQVFVQGKRFYWKPSFFLEESEEAVQKYTTIEQSGMRPDQLLTSRLYGVIVNSKGVLRGQLYHWISIDQVLRWEVVEKAAANDRKKWAAQIQKTVSALHRIGVIWGDVKAENVVIDTNGDAIVIDLEGGATNGWVDKAKMNTKQGDLQGMKRLMDYILSDDCPLRAREKAWDLGRGGEVDELMSERENQ